MASQSATRNAVMRCSDPARDVGIFPLSVHWSSQHIVLLHSILVLFHESVLSPSVMRKTLGSKSVERKEERC